MTASSGQFLTLAQFKAANQDFSNLTEFKVDGELAANESYTWNVDLTPVTTDTENIKDNESIGVWGTGGDSALSFRYAQQAPQITGQYRVVTLVSAANGSTPAVYQQLPISIQSQMPAYSADDVTFINTFHQGTTGTGRVGFIGDQIKVHINDQVKAIANANGYAVDLNQWGYLEDNPTFTLGATAPTILDAAGVDTTNFTSGIYFVLRKIVEAKDSSLTAGSTWTAADNLVAAFNDQNQNISVDKLTVKINDANGIIQNGRVMKNGQFTVIYSYATGVYPKETATVTAIITVTGAYTVNFVDRQDKVLKALVLVPNDGATQDVSAQLPDNYKLASGENGRVTLSGDADTPLVVHVEVDKKMYTVNFVNNQNQVVKAMTIEARDGDSTNIRAQVPNNYKLANGETGVVTANGNDSTPMTVHVVLDEQTYTLNFVDQTGQTIKTLSTTGVNGDVVALMALLPSGYQLANGEPDRLALISDATAPIVIQVQNSTAVADTGTTPALVSNPNAVARTNGNATLVTTANLAATTAQGTSVSVSVSTEYNNNEVVLNADATSFDAVYHVSNISGVDQYQVNVTYYLPDYPYSGASKTKMSLADTVNEATFLQHLPEGLTLTYSTDGYNFVAASQLNNNWSKILAFKITGKLAAGESHTWTLPLKILSADYYTSYGFNAIAVTNSTGGLNDYRRLAFRIARPEDATVANQYRAVTAVRLGLEYQQVPNEIQKLMPIAVPEDVSYYNLFTDSGKANVNYFSGGIEKLDIIKLNIANLVKDQGYTLLLKTDNSGQPQTYYTYQAYEESPIIHDNGNGDDAAYTPYVYVTLRQVLDTKDLQLKVGADWSQFDNLTRVMDNNDTILGASDYADKVTVTYPEGFVKDGKLVKTGTFKVTYSYKVADDYNETGQPYIVTKTALITVTGDYIIHYVDANKRIVGTFNVADGKDGDRVDVTQSIPTDYLLAANQLGTVVLPSDPGQPMTVEVTLVQKMYNIKFVTADGAVQKATTVTGAKGESLSLTAMLPEDYQLVTGTSAQLTLSGDNQNDIIITVAKITHAYTVNFVNGQGEVLKTVALSGTNGEAQNLITEIPADYQLAAGASANLTLAHPETPFEIKVTQQQHTYTVNFVNGQGEVLKTVALSGTNGEVRDLITEIPVDYQLAVGVSAQIRLAHPTMPFVINVAQVQKTYTINYVNAQRQVVKTETVRGVTGQRVNVASGVPSNYKLAANASGTVTLALDATTPITVNLVAKTAGSQGSGAASDQSQAGSTASQAPSDQGNDSQPASTGSQATSNQPAASQTTSQSSSASQASSTASAATSQRSQAANLQDSRTPNDPKVIVTEGGVAEPATRRPMPTNGNTQNVAGRFSGQATQPNVASTAEPATVHGTSGQSQVTVASAAATAQAPTMKRLAPANAAAQGQPATTTLPQTNEKDSNLAVSLGLTALVGLLGLVGLRKRERHE